MSQPAPVAAMGSVADEHAATPLPHREEIAVDGQQPAVVPPAGEACPPPLVWQEVLAAYRTDSQPWELDRGPRTLTGRTWGEGPSLYLLNGFVGTAELQSLMIWLLRDSFRCIVFDTKTGSGKKARTTSMSDYAADLMAVADHHGDSSINVFGPSFGAAVAMQASLDAPARINRLALQHGFARRKLSWFERRLAFYCGWSRRSLSSLPGCRRIQELNHRRWFPPFDGTRFEFLVESTGHLPLANLAQKAGAVNRFDIEKRLADIPCPVLLIRTEGQGEIETHGHEVLERGLRDARTEWLHSSGLHPYLTHPHRLAKLLKAFFLPNPS